MTWEEVVYQLLTEMNITATSLVLLVQVSGIVYLIVKGGRRKVEILGIWAISIISLATLIGEIIFYFMYNCTKG